MRKKLIGEGLHGKVYDNGDGTVVKITSDPSEYVLAKELKKLKTKFKYVSNYKKLEFNGIEYKITKEKIEVDDTLPQEITSLEHLWNDSLLNSHELFEYISQYLKNGIKSFMEYRSVHKFHEYLQSLKNTRQAVLKGYLFIQLCRLVQELKDNNIKGVDWNPENFGRRTGKLALFELGGAKIKK